MKETTNFRSRVMKHAYQIWLATKATWRECMKKAWQLYRLTKAMRERTVEFTYMKADGTIRQACGTLLGIPARSTINGKRMTKPSYKTVAYYDTVKNGFRCFRAENLIEMH